MDTEGRRHSPEKTRNGSARLPNVGVTTRPDNQAGCGRRHTRGTLNLQGHPGGKRGRQLLHGRGEGWRTALRGQRSGAREEADLRATGKEFPRSTCKALRGRRLCIGAGRGAAGTESRAGRLAGPDQEGLRNAKGAGGRERERQVR